MPNPVGPSGSTNVAPILSSDVPEPTSYSGRNLITLDLLDLGGTRLEEWFVGNPQQGTGAFRPPPRTPIDDLRETPETVIREALITGDAKIFPNIKAPAATHAGLFYTQSAVQRNPALSLDTATTAVLARALQTNVVQPKLDVLTEPTPGPTPGVAPTGQTSLPDPVRGSILAAPALADKGIRPSITETDIAHITAQLKQPGAGKRLDVRRSLWGEYVFDFLPEPSFPDKPGRVLPQLVLVEEYRLSSYLGNYGAGRTLNTFTLLPGEKTTISLKTFRKSATDTKSASSVLDSFSKESADDFETSLQREQSNKQAYQQSFEYHAEAEASVSWGFGSAKVSGGVKGGTSSQREEMAKSASSALQKHAAKASSKREVQVNTSTEVREESGEETAITRQLENINVSRVLNFVFRQLNQEYYTFLHLVDVRVAFWNGFSESVEEVPLSQLDTLLEKYINPEMVDGKTRRERVRELIVDQLQTIFDYKDDPVQLVEERKIADHDSYLRVRKMVSEYEDPATHFKVAVPGVILKVDKTVMRTDGVIVDALLGQGEALDGYSQGLQQTAVQQRQLENEQRQVQEDREKLAQKIVTDQAVTKAEIYRQVFASVAALPGDGAVRVNRFAGFPTIQRNSQGEPVRIFQHSINLLDTNRHLAEDGDFSATTEQACRDFQRIVGLVVDGVCGPSTWSALDTALDRAGL